MLKQLHLKNIILIDSSEIPFSPGLNVITGETGSGKTAIITALRLLSGERIDSSILRRGEEKGSVEGIFHIEGLQNIQNLLAESGIDHEKEQDLILKREYFTTGKSRAFINHQATQIGLLKQVGHLLFDVIGQHSNQKLLLLEEQHRILDLFGNLEEETSQFYHLWQEQIRLEKEIKHLTASECSRVQEIERLQFEIQELNEADLKEDEEEKLFEEYSLLSKSEELNKKMDEVIETLTGDHSSILKTLNRLKSSLDYIARVDSHVMDASHTFATAILEIQEVVHTITHYKGRLEPDPIKLNKINDRLSLINRLKKKYGGSIVEILQRLDMLEHQLKHLENGDTQLDELQKTHQNLVVSTNSASLNLSEKRKKAALVLQEEMTKILRDLNMPKVQFHVQISPYTRNHLGNDQVEFYLSPNIGEHQIPIKECASGGELSRVMLALQCLLAGKEKVPTLIFDEIDSNIGGETAAIIADKLKEIGINHQVLCITHFPQVAKKAQHHLQISKYEKGGRTHTKITIVEGESKQEELIRMTGGMR